MITVLPLSLRMSSAYLLENKNGLFLIDAGSPGDERALLNAIRQRGKPLQLIFITHAHFDHYGSAAALRRQTGAPVLIHPADAQAMAHGETPIRQAHGRGRIVQLFHPWFERLMPVEPTKADAAVEDNAMLIDYGLNAAVLHTPGHTPGSCSLMVENELAFAGDLLSNSGRPRLQRFFADNWSQLPVSLARLQAKKPAKVYTGHGIKPIDAEAFKKIC